MPEYEVTTGTVEKDGEQYGPAHDRQIITLAEERAAFLGEHVRYHGESESGRNDEEPGRRAVENAPSVADVTGESEAGESDGDAIAHLMDGTLDELESALESGDWDDSINALHEFEENNQDRSGAYDLLQQRKSSINSDNRDDGDNGES